jgi:arylsulfatase A-like enzyme
MMTGVTPLVHGVRKFEDRIPSALPTLAERMRAAGYLTAAFGDQLFLHPQHGISRGFQSYELSPRDEYGGSVGSRILGWAFPARFKRALDTTEITDLTLAWLELHAHDDFFLWLHYFKPHGPYEPLSQYRPKEEPPAGMSYKFSADNAIRAGSLVITAEQRPWVRKLYEGELRYVDDNVGRVLAELKRLGIYDDMLIVFVSDHGEEFWDHDARAHGHTFYDELLRVPLFVKLPGEGLRERRSELVCTGSIFPTLLDFAAIPREAGASSYAPLTPLLGGAGEPYQEVPVLGSVPLYFEDRESIVFGDTKYIVSLVTSHEQLYDLKNDPREQRNLAGEPSAALLQARSELEAARQSSAALRKHYGIQAETGAPLSPETIEQLRSLGYVR